MFCFILPKFNGRGIYYLTVLIVSSKKLARVAAFTSNVKEAFEMLLVLSKTELSYVTLRVFLLKLFD